jgi:hypothetical protein
MANVIQHTPLAAEFAGWQQVEMGEQEATSLGLVNNHRITHDHRVRLPVATRLTRGCSGLRSVVP